MNPFAVVEVFYSNFKVMTGSLSYDEALKAMNKLKREFPERNFDTRLSMPQYIVGGTYNKSARELA